MLRKFALNLLLMVLLSLTEGVGLILLIPLLQLVGLDMGQQTLNQIANTINLFFSSLGLQPTLYLVLAIYVVVISFNALLHRWQMIMTYHIEFQYAAYLRKRLYRAITNSDWLFFSRHRSSDFAHALTNEIERIGTGTTNFLVLLASIMILVIYIIFALKLAGLTTGLIFLAGIALLLLLRERTYSSRSSGEEITSSTRKIYSSIIQHLEGMKTIKSFGMQQENIKIFSIETDQVVKSYMDSIRSYVDVKLLFDIGTVIILAIVVLFLIEIIKIPLAALLVLIYLFVRLIPLFSTIQSSYQYVLNMLPAYSNVTNLEKECLENSEPTRNETAIELEKKISLEDVTFSYQDHHFTIKELNLHIPAGQTTALAGPSGAGKSTIADLVMGLIQPASGRIIVDDRPLHQKSWTNKIGYVAQDTFLFNESIKFNLKLSQPDASEEELKEALQLAAAYEFVSSLPEGLDTVIGDRGVKLSGGERQRLALARALLRKPSLLILDEATSNLDSENEERIMKAIEGLHGRTTILIITHRLSTIKNADHIYLISEGQVIGSGSWDQLLKDKVWFQNICEAQGLDI